MMRQALESMANSGTERAADRRATARRLVAEVGPFRSRLVAALGLVVLSAGAQALGPLIIGRAIDRAIGPGDRRRLVLLMLALAGVYVVGALASRGQTRQIGETGQRVLAGLRE